MKYKRDPRGAKRKTPTTALMALIQKNGKSTYSFQKAGILSAGNISNSAKKDYHNWSMGFCMKIADGLNMKLSYFVKEIQKLQKKYPVQSKKHRHQNTYVNKKK